VRRGANSMRTTRGVFRTATWFCVLLLGFLSLLPAQEMVRTGLPGLLEHFIAYAGTAAVAMIGYGRGNRGTRVIGLLCAYAGTLEYFQNFSPGRHPRVEDFVASAFGALCGGLAAAVCGSRWERGEGTGRHP
jgi:VanZ family protein